MPCTRNTPGDLGLIGARLETCMLSPAAHTWRSREHRQSTAPSAAGGRGCTGAMHDPVRSVDTTQARHVGLVTRTGPLILQPNGGAARLQHSAHCRRLSAEGRHGRAPGCRGRRLSQGGCAAPARWHQWTALNLGVLSTSIEATRYIGWGRGRQNTPQSRNPQSRFSTGVCPRFAAPPICGTRHAQGAPSWKCTCGHPRHRPCPTQAAHASARV